MNTQITSSYNKSQKTLGRMLMEGIAGLVALAVVSCAAGAVAQNSAPAPGAGGSFTPAPSGGFGGMGPGMMNPGPPPPSSWGGPWGGGWNGWCSSPTIIVNTPLSSPVWQNSGVTTVVGCGYDAQGIWRSIPMRVSYRWNGVQYKVTVLNAWNPWSDMWNRGVDAPAYNTSYYLRGNTYDFYTVLSTGTYYFNL